MHLIYDIFAKYHGHELPQENKEKPIAEVFEYMYISVYVLLVPKTVSHSFFVLVFRREQYILLGASILWL
jgi:hypothetical protein